MNLVWWFGGLLFFVVVVIVSLTWEFAIYLVNQDAKKMRYKSIKSRTGNIHVRSMCEKGFYTSVSWAWAGVFCTWI